MASRLPDRSAARFGGAIGASGLPVLVGSIALRLPLAANDNKAPLRRKVRRLVLFTVAALAVGWLFWVGLLR